jgi:hypothetical protein
MAKKENREKSIEKSIMVGKLKLFNDRTREAIVIAMELDEILSQREKINLQLQEILDRSTEPWGIKVSHVEVKQIDLPEEMKRAIAKQAEAERERRAKVINAEGEFQAAQKLDRCGSTHGNAAHVTATSLSPDLEHDRGREQLHDPLSHPDRPVQTVPKAGRKELNAHETMGA